MGLIDTLRTLLSLTQERSAVWPGPMTGVDNFWPFVNFNGNTYPIGLNETLRGEREEIAGGFTGYVNGAYKANAVVFALMTKRQMLFSQGRFRYQRLRNGQPEDFWGDASLSILEHPWRGAATGDLLSRAMIDNDAAGNFYATRKGGRIVRMRPDWVSLIIGSDQDDDVVAGDLDAELLALVYYPGGKYSGRKPEILPAGQFAHFALHPDPTASYMGMSWLTPVVREIMGDQAATSHKLKFFEHGATPNMVIKRLDAPAKAAFEEWRDMMESGHAGVANAYKTLYLTAGADATVVGKDLQQLDFKLVQGAGETRLAAAAQIHPAIAGLSEGLQGASLNAGNFGAARRLVADTFLIPAWDNFATSMEQLVPPPAGSRLWHDDSRVPFLREDSKDAAEILKEKMLTIESGIRGGFEPESVKKAVVAGDLSLLTHTGLYSVQLQPPGVKEPASAPMKPDMAPPNGTKPMMPTGGAK